MKKHTFLNSMLWLASMSIAALTATSCADDLDSNGNNTGKTNALTLKFNTADYHQDADARITRIINAKAPNGQSIKVVETDYNFIEDNLSSVAAHTRGTMYDNIDAMPDDTKFGIFGYSSTTDFNNIGNEPNFINKGVAGKNGKVSIGNEQKKWEPAQKYMQIAGTYPSTIDLKKSGEDFSFSYTPDGDCLKQQDVMLGMTQAQIIDSKTEPETNLILHHTLTAVNVAIGDKLKLDGLYIKGIEIKNAAASGECKATAPIEKQSFTWTAKDINKTFSLKFPSAIEAAKNTQLTGNKDQNGKRDNYTFLMVPLTKEQGKYLQLVVYLCNKEGKELTPLTLSLGSDNNYNNKFNGWQAGHTITYTITGNKKNNSYIFEQKKGQNTAKSIDDGKVWASIKSFKSLKVKNKDKYSTKVGYEVTGYDYVDEQGTERKNVKQAPDWFKLEKTSFEGSVTDIKLEGEFKNVEPKDLLAELNKSLKEVHEGGAINLATGTASDKNMTTANCYVIEKAGQYKLPLVYGNALKNGEDNKVAYQTKGVFPTHEIIKEEKDNVNNKGCINGENINVNKNCKRHKDIFVWDKSFIHSPWIKDNGEEEEYKPVTAGIVWTDVDNNKVCNGLIQGLTVDKDGKYLTFTVNKDKIKSGNAVIKVMNKKGTTLWSWHLWFARKSDLQDFKLDNNSILSQNVGWKYKKWQYSPKKSITVHLTQKETNNEIKIVFNRPDVINIDGISPHYLLLNKNPYSIEIDDKHSTVTLTRFKPKYYNQHAAYLPEVNVKYTELVSFGYSIQHPEEFFLCVHGDNFGVFNKIWMFLNNNMKEGIWTNNDAKKNVYDPCPAGYQNPNYTISKSIANCKTVKKQWGEYCGVFLGQDNKKCYLPNVGIIWGYSNEKGKVDFETKYSRYATTSNAKVKDSGLNDKNDTKGHYVYGKNYRYFVDVYVNQINKNSRQKSFYIQAKNSTPIRPMKEQ